MCRITHLSFQHLSGPVPTFVFLSICEHNSEVFSFIETLVFPREIMRASQMENQSKDVPISRNAQLFKTPIQSEENFGSSWQKHNNRPLINPKLQFTSLDDDAKSGLHYPKFGCSQVCGKLLKLRIPRRHGPNSDKSAKCRT